VLVLGIEIEQPEVEGWLGVRHLGLPHALEFVLLQEVAQLGHGAPWHKALQQIVVGRTVQPDAQQQHLLFFGGPDALLVQLLEDALRATLRQSVSTHFAGGNKRWQINLMNESKK